MSIYNELKPDPRGGAVKVGDPPYKLNHSTVTVIAGPGEVHVDYAPYNGLIVIGVESVQSNFFKPATARFTLPEACGAVRLKVPGPDADTAPLPTGVKISLYDSSEALVKTYAAPYVGEIDYEAEGGKTISYIDIEASGSWLHIAALKFYS